MIRYLALVALTTFAATALGADDIQTAPPESGLRSIFNGKDLSGWNGDPNFSDQVFKLIYEASGGVPRRINLLSDRILLHGFIEGEHNIDSDLVNEVVHGMSDEGLVPAMTS